MNTRFIPAALVAAMMAVTVLPSCKKKEDDPTRAQMLVGTWKSTQEGEDTNNNGTWDASERENIPANEAATTVFNSNGTGTLTAPFFPISINFTWALQNSDNDLRMTTDFMGTQETITQNIVSISNTEIITKESDSSGTYFYAMTKQ